MRTDSLYIWRILWTGKWRHTRYHCTEEHIRLEHPEALRLPSTLIVREVPETDEEIQAKLRAVSRRTSQGRTNPDGTVKMEWER